MDPSNPGSSESNSNGGASSGLTNTASAQRAQPVISVSVVTPNDQKSGMGDHRPSNLAPVIQFQVTPNANSSPHAPSFSVTSNAVQPDPTGFALSDFLSQLEDYTPTIPDAVANYFLQQAGFDSTDPRLSRLISLAAQKFISDIVNESFIHCKLKAAVPVGKQKAKDKNYVLTLDDLMPILNDYGITVKKPPYFV